MFLIEYKECEFINAELIDWISVKNERVEFTFIGDSENIFRAHGGYALNLVVGLQSINGNISNIERAYTVSGSRDK